MITIHYFYMKGCPHCVTTNPEWKKLRKHFRSERKQNKISFKKTESKKITPALREQFSIEGFPTIVMYIQQGDNYLHLEHFEEDRTVDKLREFIIQYQTKHQSNQSSLSKQSEQTPTLHYVPKSRWMPPPMMKDTHNKYPSSLLDKMEYPVPSSTDSSTIDNTDEILKKVIESIESDIDDLSEEEPEEEINIDEFEEEEKPEEEVLEEEDDIIEDKKVSLPQDSYVSQFTELDTEPSSESPNLYQYLYEPNGTVTNISSKQGTHSLENLMKSLYQKMSNTHSPSVDSLFESEDYSQMNDEDNSHSYQIPYQSVESSLRLPSCSKQVQSPQSISEPQMPLQIKPEVISVDIITPSQNDIINEEEESLSSEEFSSDDREPIITNQKPYKECLSSISNQHKVSSSSPYYPYQPTSPYPIWI